MKYIPKIFDQTQPFKKRLAKKFIKFLIKLFQSLMANASA